MTSKIPLPVTVGHSGRNLGVGTGSNNNNNNNHHSNPTSPRSTSPTSPSPTFGRIAPTNHHPHYRNHNPNRDSNIHNRRPSPFDPSSTPQPTTISPPKFEAFMMTGDLMINLASKQTEINPQYSQHEQSLPQERLPIFRRKKPINQTTNLHSSSIQFGDEPVCTLRATKATASLPSSPDSGQSKDLKVVPSRESSMDASGETTNVRLSKSETQLKATNGTHQEDIIQVVMDSNEGDSSPILVGDGSTAQTRMMSQGTSTNLELPAQLDGRLSVSSATSTESRRSSSLEGDQDTESDKPDGPLTRSGTFNKKDIERLHAMKEEEVSEVVDSQEVLPTDNNVVPLPSSTDSTNSSLTGAQEVPSTSSLVTPLLDSTNPAKTTTRYPSFLSGPESPELDHDLAPSPPGLSFPPVRSVDVASASRLAKRLFELQGFKKSDICRQLSKNNDFSQVVAEEYTKLFDFTEERLDESLRKFLSKFSLVGETNERERVLGHFSRRYFECNPTTYTSSDAIHTLTCALMLLNTDLHSDTIGRKMTCSEFTENLRDLHDGGNFESEQLKVLYTSIKNEPLQWAIEEEDSSANKGGYNLISLLGVGGDRNDSRLAESINPFLAIPSGSATEFKKGYLVRKTCFDSSGKKTPIGKRSWKTFFTTLRDLVLYLHKDETGFQKNQLYDSLKNSVRIHHSLASKATDYSKKDHVFRLQTADQAEYLLKATDGNELTSWIDAINFAAASLSAPALAPAVSSENKFQRPLLPVSHTKFNMRDQFLDHQARLSKLEGELDGHLNSPPQRTASKRILSEYTQKQLYLQFEIKRYRTYANLLRERLEQSLGSQVLEKILQRSLTTQSKPLTSFSIGEESDDSDDSQVDSLMVHEPVILPVKRRPLRK